MKFYRSLPFFCALAGALLLPGSNSEAHETGDKGKQKFEVVDKNDPFVQDVLVEIKALAADPSLISVFDAGTPYEIDGHVIKDYDLPHGAYGFSTKVSSDDFLFGFEKDGGYLVVDDDHGSVTELGSNFWCLPDPRHCSPGDPVVTTPNDPAGTGSPAAVPEPSTYALFSGSVGLLLFLARRKWARARVTI